ncbi:MAG: polysaccharide deacetylase family protein [Thermomicrobiales bacterium]
MKRSFSVFALLFTLSLTATTLMENQARALASPATTNQADTTTADCWATSADGPAYVPETGHHIYEPFLSVWRQYDLAILGYPVSEPIEQDGMIVQYFERARFEQHPEFAGTPYEVLFTLLGHWIATEHDDPAFNPLQPDISQPDPSARYYPETGHYLQAPFSEFWDEYGGLPVFGYPISEMLLEDGMLVQYFERARFEHHPEHAGTRYEILLGHLGREFAEANGVDQQPVPMLENAVDYRWNPEPRSFRIPVLMYHQLGTPVSRYRVSYWDFEQQMIWLRDNGYTPVTMTEAYAGMFGGGSLPDKPAIITFDDGPQSQWAAADILDQYGYKGIFFVHPNGELRPDQLRDLVARGHEIGSHSFSHPYLTQVSDDQLWYEVYDSRIALEEITGSRVNFFAYPFGAWDSRVISVVKAAGYCGAVHAWEGQMWTPEKRWNEPRVEISGELSLAAFASLIEYQPQASERDSRIAH